MNKKLIIWTARVFALLAILFFVVFSFDCFESGSLRDKFVCFVMHNIPAFILIAILIVAWRWSFTGGILFILAALAGAVFFRAFSGNPGVWWLLTPLILVGMLFILQDERIWRKQ